MSCPSLLNGRKFLLSIVSSAAKDQKHALLSGGGAADNADRAEPKIIPSLLLPLRLTTNYLAPSLIFLCLVYRGIP